MEYRFYANDFINAILCDINNATYKVLYQRQKIFLHLKHNEIILMDNIRSFKYFFSKLYNVGNMNLSRTLLFISSLKTLDYDTIYLIFKDLYRMDIIRIVLVVELSQDDIVMLTYFPFTPTSCRSFEPVIINHYLVDEQRWENIDYFPHKLNNFYGCRVTCCTWQDMPYLSVKPYKKNNNNAIDYVGMEAELLKFVAGRLNFSIDINWIDPIKEDVTNKGAIFAKVKLLEFVLGGKSNFVSAIKFDGDIHIDFVITFVIRRCIGLRPIKMFARTCDFALGGFSYRKDLDSTSTFSQTNYFMLSPIYIVTNVINFYTTYEKLAFPFHYTVWFALGLIFALSSLLICTCGQRRQWLRYRNFLIGSANKTPHFHLYALAVGATMTTAQMPKHNFARFLLTCWLMVTLILRNAYQSGIYQMLRDNKQWNPPQTIENVFEQNYLISTTPENRRYFDILPDVKRKQLFNTTILETFSELLNAEKPIAFITPYEYYGYFGKVNGSQWQHLHLVRERLLTQQLTIYVRHHSYFINVLNDQISDAQYHGFITLWNRQYSLSMTTALKLSSYIQMNGHLNSDKNPLSMNELGAIFMILVWLHVLSCGVFLIELMWHRYGNVVRNWLHLKFKL
ncbi:uncharacterized protein LOC119604700 [Lucilia sericata]|uniref:uncharacterized protein LOC119604700 n=1 Tax=Lucilia sericata TaxID=13632 RepID=UPI0018A85EF5|nr:uncharacterized protein LOC119604700 [Lucilia sericata]